MNNDKMREEFEGWCCAADDGPQIDPQWMIFELDRNRYALDRIQGDWVVWQASRAALVISMPIDVTGGLYRLAVEDSTRCIEAAGVKVKP